MIRFLTLLRLKCRAYALQEQAEHAEALLADHERRYEMLILELRKVKSRISTLERPEVLLRQALRRT